MTQSKLRFLALWLLFGGLPLLVGGCVGGGMPVVNVLTVPSTVVEGTTVNITVQATSGGGGPIIYSWTATCGGTFVPNPSDPIPSGQTHTVQWTAPAVTADTPCTVTVTATSRGRSSTASRSTTVLRIPTVVSTVPAHNATAVPVTVDIVVTFDGPMNPATVSLICLDEDGPEGCNMTISAPVWSAGNSVATYTVGDPDAPFPVNLEFLETYFMRVTGSSAAGVPMAAPYDWSFTTATANPPVISAMTVPSPVIEGTTGHTVSVTASDSAPLSYSWSATGPGICSSITFSPNNSTAASTSTMTVPNIPPAPLPRTDLSCTVSVTVSGPGGSTSSSRPLTVQRIPFVVSTVPANNQTGVLVTTEVQVTFDGSMTPASLALLCTNEGPATFPVTGTPCNATFGTPTWSDAYGGAAPNSRVDVPVGDPDASPTTNLQYDRGYRFQVNANSASGVAMAAPYGWEFATEAAPLGRIVINKTAVGGDATFSYTTSGTGGPGDLPPSFQITTSGGSGSQTFNNINPGTYTVTEASLPDWDLTNLVCIDPDNGTTVDIGTRTATIDLDTGEIVTCTFTNTKRGTIVINKTAVGGDATFSYTTSGTGGLPASFQITTTGGSGSQTFSNIVPGSHTVTEDVAALPPNWNFTGLSCTDPDGGTTVSGATANIDLDPGETVTCTYTNTLILPQCPANLIPESEPNDTNATAQPLNLAPGQGVAIVSGGITPAGDLDYYQITVTEPSLVFAYVRTNLATASADSTLFIGVNPVTTGSGCAGTGFAECDDDDGGQTGVSSSIAGLSLSPGTYNILVKQYGATGAPGSGSTMTPYRLYVAVVPTASVISESEPNNSPSAGQIINSCPAVISGTGGGAGASDYYRFLVPGGNTVLWVSAAQPVIGQWNSRLELWRVSTGAKIPFTAAAGIPNCDSAGTGAAGNPASESCSMHHEYDSADRWPATPEDYAVNIRRNADPDTGAGGTYYLLIVVMTDVGPVPPPLPPNLPAIFAYAKRPSPNHDTVMRLRTTTAGVPVYSSCAAATPPDIECDDDAGHTYTSPAGVVYPPTGGGNGFNSAIAGHPFQNISELIFIQGYGATTIIGPFDLYIHVPDGTLGQLTEANDTGNGTIGGAEAVPALPTCTAVYSEATGNQRPGFGAGGSDNVPVPAPSAGWTMDGSFSSDTDVDYYGPISVGPTDRVFIAIDGSLDYLGAPHDHNGYNADISFSLRTPADAIIGGITIDGDSGLSQGALAEVFSGTPGAVSTTFYIRVAAKTGDAFKGYRLTACKFP